MAEKKNSSRAEKMVSEAKKKTSGSASSGRSSQTTAKKKNPQVKTEYESAIPSGAIVSLISLGLFLLFFVISVKPEGALLQLLQSVILGLIGQGAFYAAIPAFFYLFVINTFGKKRFVEMKSICTIIFVFVCGCIFHLLVQDQGMASGTQVIADLYGGGFYGISGGVICGGVALLLRWACGNIMAILLCVLIALFTFLAALGITPASLVRAFANRPRYEEDEEEEYIEPATIVVNHIANKQIEHKRQRKQALQAAREMQLTQNVQSEQQLPQSAANKAVKNKPAAPRTGPDVKPVKQQIPEETMESADLSADYSMEVTSGTPSRAKHIMNTIEMDSSVPVRAAEKRVSEPIPDAIGARPVQKGVLVEADEEVPVSRGMPKLELDSEPPAFVMNKPAVPSRQPAAKSVERTKICTEAGSEGRAQARKSQCQGCGRVCTAGC